MLRFSSSRFGELTVENDKAIYFSEGIIGFPWIKRYVILDHYREAPFKWLQAVDDPDVAFVIVEPSIVKPDYTPAIDKENIADIDIKDELDICILLIVTIPHRDPTKVSINLQAPIIVNVENKRAKQIVLNDVDLSCYPLLQKS
ncbi:MAG: flagellar assembly protein FliW [Nitrospirota bacterium]